MIVAKKYLRLRGAMVAAGLTQDDLATILRISPTSVSNRFCGRQDWRLSEMYNALEHLGIDHPATVLGQYFPPFGINEVDND